MKKEYLQQCVQKCTKKHYKGGKKFFTYKYLESWADRRERKLLEKDIKREFEAIKCFKVFQEKSVMQNTRFLWKTLSQSETTLKSLYFSKACSISSQGHLIMFFVGFSVFSKVSIGISSKHYLAELEIFSGLYL